MAERVCPPWVGYLLLSPLRKLGENPRKLLGPHVREGMTVLEPGAAMGFFTLPLARMVGPAGRVVVIEVQPKMLEKLERRARKAGVLDRLDLRLADDGVMPLGDLAGAVDFTAAIHVVHEIPNQESFFGEVLAASKPGGKLLLIEPKGHVSPEKFAQSVATAESVGFVAQELPRKVGGRAALLARPA